MAKRRAARYEPGRRSAAWIKTALIRTQEVLIGGWTVGEGRRTRTFGSLLLGAHDADGSLRYLGHVGTGFSDAVLDDLMAPPAAAGQADQPVRRGRAARARPQGPLGGARPGR